MAHSHRSTVLAMATVLALAALPLVSSGCAWIHASKIKKRTNPKYRDGKAPIPKPTLVMAPVECDETPDDVIRDRRLRPKFAQSFFPAFDRAFGPPATSGSAGIGRALCQAFYLSKDYPPWEGNEGTREIAREVLDGEHQSLLVPIFAFTHSCRSKTETVRNRSGQVVATVDKDEVICRQGGGVHLMFVALSQQGELLWHSGRRTTVGANPRRVVADLAEGWPRPSTSVAAGQ